MWCPEGELRHVLLPISLQARFTFLVILNEVMASMRASISLP